MKAYSFWDKINEPLVCNLFDANLVYYMPASNEEDSVIKNVKVNCVEINDRLNYTIPSNQDWFKDVKINN